jgi:hypothetical protein
MLECTASLFTEEIDQPGRYYSLICVIQSLHEKRSEAEPVEKDQQNCKNRRDELQKQVLVYTTKQQTNSLICFASFLLQLSLMVPAMWMFSVIS